MKDKRLVIDHIGVGVRDYEESVAFYSRALAPLGLELVAETETDNRAAGFGYTGRLRPLHDHKIRWLFLPRVPRFLR